MYKGIVQFFVLLCHSIEKYLQRLLLLSDNEVVEVRIVNKQLYSLLNRL